MSSIKALFTDLWRGKNTKKASSPTNKDTDLNSQDGSFKVMVAIDFGTYGTGLGFVKTGDDKIYIEQDWCVNDKFGAKNRTDVLLSADGELMAFGDKALNMLSES